MEYIDLFKDKLGEDNVRLNESMARHTSFKTGGPADVFIKVDSVENLKYVLKISKEYDVPLFILGNGSNILVTDKGIRGIVCKICIKKFEYPGAIIRSKRNKRKF